MAYPAPRVNLLRNRSLLAKPLPRAECVALGNARAVLYCKRGYFCLGKISRKCWRDISRGDNFHDNTTISFIKAYGFHFRVGVIFAKMTKAQKT